MVNYYINNLCSLSKGLFTPLKITISEDLPIYSEYNEHSHKQSSGSVMYMTWHDMIWHDMMWHVMVWYGMRWCNMMWYDMVWHGMTDHDMNLRVKIEKPPPVSNIFWMVSKFNGNALILWLLQKNNVFSFAPKNDLEMQMIVKFCILYINCIFCSKSAQVQHCLYICGVKM